MTEAEMATGCEKTKYGDDEHCDDDDQNRLDDYNGDGEEGAEVIKVADDEGTEDEKTDDDDESDDESDESDELLLTQTTSN